MQGVPAMNKAILDADRLGAETQGAIDAMYTDVVAPILTRYKKTLESIEKYNEQGKRGLARSLFRSSGLLDELAEAIAGAGRAAAGAVQQQRADIMEVMADDDGT